MKWHHALVNLSPDGSHLYTFKHNISRQVIIFTLCGQVHKKLAKFFYETFGDHKINPAKDDYCGDSSDPHINIRPIHSK